MKNKLLAILLVVVILLGGAYFLTRDKVDSSDSSIEDQEKVEETLETSQAEGDSDSVKAENLERVDEVEVGKLPPDFIYEDKDGKQVKLTNLDGEEISLDDYKGKIVMLNFWGTWCHWCDVEMPDLDKFDKDNEDLVVLAVNVQENEDTVKKYIDKGGYEFEVVLDPEGQIARKYFVASFPISYFLDKDGIFLGGHEGALNYEQMGEYLKIIRENEK